jgi:hypothetical protein
MVQCSKTAGLGKIISKAFGFGGSEMYIKSVPEHLEGFSFFEASLYYPRAVILGITTKTTRGKSIYKFCPSNRHALKADEQVVLLAENDSCALADEEPCMQSFTYMQSLLEPHHDASFLQASVVHVPDVREPEQIIVIGWNDSIGIMLLELDLMVPPSTTMLILAPKSTQEREEYLRKAFRRRNREPKNITNIKHVEGMLGSRFQLEDLPIPLEEASRIFIIADNEDSKSVQETDARTVVTILQIRDILSKKGMSKSIPVIPEMRSPETEKNCFAVQASDFIDTSGLPAQVLAMIAYQPQIKGVLEEIMSEASSVAFSVRNLKDYMPPGEPLPTSFNFFQASSWVRVSGDVLVGWTKPCNESLDAPKKNQTYEGEDQIPTQHR